MKKPTLVYTTFIQSTAKKTWDAITKPEFTRKYWAGMTNVSDWKKGSKWQHVAEDKDIYITGKVVESVPPKRLVVTWADPDELKDQSRVTFEIESMKKNVCLTVTHDQFKTNSKMAGKVSWGWPRVLSSLKSYLETGKALDSEIYRRK